MHFIDTVPADDDDDDDLHDTLNKQEEGKKTPLFDSQPSRSGLLPTRSLETPPSNEVGILEKNRGRDLGRNAC